MNTPSVPPELRQWILAQAQAGQNAPALLAALVQAGWQEAQALAALQAVLHTQVDSLARAQGLPASVPVPELALEDDPTTLDAGDRQVQVLLTMALPRVVLLGNVLSPEECDALMAAARPRMARSLTVETDTGGESENQARTSQGMFFERGENPVVARVEARLARLARWPVEHGEGLQVLRYQRGNEYQPHYDYFDPSQPGTPHLLRRGGQRVATFVLYLNTPEQGGATTFPDVGLDIAPRQGHAVFFSYPRPHPSTRSLHGGSPVIEGEKWIATKWLRDREFT